jgi:hypothetical protein
MRRLIPLVLLALPLMACDPDTDPGTDGGQPPPECDYPAYSGALALNEIMPNWRWEGAQMWDGEGTTIDMQEFFCSSDYDEYSSIVLVISAGWCPACPEYIAYVDSISGTLEDEGAMILYVEVETRDFEPATSTEASTFINGIISDGPGLRIGDADNTQPNSVRGLVSRMPSGYFIRRRDMRIIADQSQSVFQLDFGGLAADPEQDWIPMPPPFVANCGPADEEALEPNDSIEDAKVIDFDGEVVGGVCAEGSDFYRIEEEGLWRFDLYSEYLTTREDLNLRLFLTNGERIGGSTQRSNHDWIDFAGPAIVEVYGFDNDSATYRVTLGPQP